MKIISEDRDCIETFLDGARPGYPTIADWIDAVIFYNGWGARINAADVKQKCLMALLENFREKKFQGGSLKSYVQTVAKNKCLMALRASYRDKTVCIDDEYLVAPTGNPDSELLAKERYATFLRIFRQLAGPCKKLLILRHIKSLSFSDLAAQLGMAEGAARVRHHRCLEAARKLREQLEKE